MKMADAKQKRNEQLKRWLGSETDQEPPVLKKKKTKVKFDDGAVFLAACSSGDTEEVLRMLDRGADINYANVDGLTALHQACIDDNIDMVTFLVEHGAGINQPDNEGWIPLHAAASCGYLDIAEYLIRQGASVGVVNSEGDTPLDIAEEEAMGELLQNEINKQGVDIEAARKEEERVMLRDARQWLNSGQIQDPRHTKSGGTALHVAAAKGYVEVLKLLIQTGYDVNIKDYDGWTPLHAASHWGKEEACRILVENMCDMDLINKMGQTAFDVADEDVLGYLEELQKKQNLLIGEKKEIKKSPLIETKTTEDNNQSLKPLNSKETLLLEPEKIAPRIETLEPEKVDEGEEGKKDESSCSSEEEDDEDSESETEADKSKTSASVSNSTTPPPASAPASPPTSPTNQVTTPTSPVKKPTAGKASTKVEDDRKDESPASWRLGLRKTGSYGALAEITATKEAQREKDTTGVMRSASSPRLSSSLDNKDKEKEKDKGSRLAYVAPNVPRRLASTSDIDEKENRDSTALKRSGSYTRRRWDDDLKNSEGSASTNRTPSYQRSGSFGRRHEDLSSSTTSSSTNPTTTSTTTSSSVTSPTGHRSLLSGLGSSTRTGSTSLTSRYWSEESADREKEKESAAVIPTMNTGSTTTSTSTTSTSAVSTTTTTSTGVVTGSERRRSYLTPVRDEESESQRKARSRQARQSRRSTQGVTLTDLQEAEKTIDRSRVPKSREEEKQDKEKQEEKKELEVKEDDYRSKYRSFEERYRPSSSSSTSAISTVGTASTPYTSSALSSSSLSRPNSLTGITSSYSRSSRDTEKEMDRKEEEKEGEDKSQPRSIRDRRRPREKRRSTGVSFWTQEGDENDPDQLSDSEDGSTKGEPQSDRLSSTTSLDRNDILSSRGYGESRRTYSSRLDRDDATDYKKLYEQILAENEKLKAQLRDTDLELGDLKLQLEKATQRQERYADRSQLEMEKRERRALERKISEMEEELKMLPDLKADNQRLKDENGALIRVISKLSK
ncbi:protein phosphatase 1 regulatory subunit 12A isoform X13 [Gasterosteus aculeatus]